MKLRQKLAVVLASAMVVTAVPVVTMAASTNGVNKVVTVSKDADNATTTSVLKIETKDVVGKESFVIKLENAKFPAKSGDYKAMVTDAGLGSQLGAFVESITISTETEAIVTVNGNGIANIPLFVKMIGGDASVEIISENSSVTAGKYIFAKTPVADKRATVTADTKAFYEGTNTIGAITFTDVTPGSISTAEAKDRLVTLTVDHSDYEFASATSTLTVTTGRGYATKTVDVVATRVANDAQTVTFTLPTDLAVGTINGTLKVEGLQVKATTKTPEVGDLNVEVKAGIIADTTVKVAEVQDYTVKLSGDKVEYVAGAANKEVKFKLTETLADTISRNREIEFSINHGKVTKITNPDSAKFEVALIDDKDDNKFTVKVKDGVTAKIDQEFKIEFVSDVDYEGDITLTATGKRAIGDDLTHVIATATRDFDYSSESAVVKVGLKGQKVGKVELTETVKGAFEKGKTITLSIPAGEGVKLAGKPDVKVTGDDKFKYTVKDPVTSNGVISVDIVVDRASVAPITMTIENLPVDVDRTVAEGTAKLEIKGDAIAVNGKISLDDFFVVGTPNTEALAANGLPKGTATFAIGSAEYKVNDKAATMDAAAYIQDPGYTMVPVRYVATAFGVAEKDILFSAGTATIFAGSRTVQLTAGSDVAIVNGASIKLATKVVVKDGRTYAPVGEIARILGISANWDATAKVATFENK